MAAFFAILGPLMTLVLSLITAIAQQKAAHTQEKQNAANEISSAVASGDPGLINAAINKLRS